jgi:capsular polysaccharide biosynthesis protein
MDGVHSAFVATCTRGVELGPVYEYLPEWTSGIATEPGLSHTLTVEAPKEVAVRSIPLFQEKIATEYPNLYRWFFESTSYLSDAFRVTYAARPLVCGATGVMLQRNEQTGKWVCLTETIGDSVRMAVHFTNPYQSLDKQGDATELTANFTDVEVLDDDYLALSLSWINNFGHWHVHNFPFLLWVKDNLPAILAATKTKGVRLICPGGLDAMGKGMKRHIADRLAAICPVQLLQPELMSKPVLLQSALLSSAANLDNGPVYPPIFRPLFSQLRVPADQEAPQYIYCNRSHVGHRGVDNEAEVEAALARIGFVSVATGALDYDTVRRCFSNARLIVSPHGSSVTPLIFSHRQPTVIELSHPYYGPVQYTTFRNLTSAMSGRYGTLISPVPEKYHGANYNGTFFRVDVDWLSSALASLKSEMEMS